VRTFLAKVVITSGAVPLFVASLIGEFYYSSLFLEAFKISSVTIFSSGNSPSS